VIHNKAGADTQYREPKTALQTLNSGWAVASMKWTSSGFLYSPPGPLQ
jgi:hypothetical protein